jgi:hypothetical protein
MDGWRSHGYGIANPPAPMTSLNSVGSNNSNGSNGFGGNKQEIHTFNRPIRELKRDENGRFVFVARHNGLAANSTGMDRGPVRQPAPPVIRKGPAERPGAASTAGQPGTALALVRYIESSATTHDLVVAAGQHLFNQSTTPKTQTPWLRNVVGKAGVWTFGEELHGTQAVTKGLRDQSHLPAKMLSASTLFDFVGSLGLFQFICQASPIGALPSALFFSGALLFISKHTGGGMVNRLKSNGTASVSMGIFFTIATIQSLTTGVGVFLFNGQSKVVNHTASELLAADFKRRDQRISSLRDPANQALLQADVATCESNIKQLDRAGVNNPAYQQLSVETFGRWEDRRVLPSNQPRWVIQNWERQRWPICPRAAANKVELEQRIQKESGELERLQQQAQEAPSPAVFLRQNQPQVFAEHFRIKADGTVEMKDGFKAFGSAMNFFWNPPEGSSSDLTLSYLMMWLSIGTSLGAFLLLLRYSLKDETKMSFSEPCGQYRSELLSQLQRRLPDELVSHFRDQGAKERRQDLQEKPGVRLDQIDKLTPEFQTLAYLAQNGDGEVRRQAHQQYFERLVDLYVQRSNVTGEIDYAYLAHKVTRYWADLKVADQARVTPQGSALNHNDRG